MRSRSRGSARGGNESLRIGGRRASLEGKRVGVRTATADRYAPLKEACILSESRIELPITSKAEMGHGDHAAPFV
jgi:hypothetical protein